MLVERNDPGLMTEPQVKAACQVALDAWKTFGCRDAGRVDIRFSSNEPDAVPNVLEVSLPTLASSKAGDFCLIFYR
jgi:hypothetical protein